MLENLFASMQLEQKKILPWSVCIKTFFALFARQKKSNLGQCLYRLVEGTLVTFGI